MRNIILIPIPLLLTFIVLSSQSMAQNESYREIENHILELEGKRFQAMIEVDTVILDSILADELTYTHTNGWLQTKEELMSTLESGELNYTSAITNDVVVRTYETSAIVTGTASMKVESQEKEYNLRISFIDVYVKKNGYWQMVAWQSTRIPED